MAISEVLFLGLRPCPPRGPPDRGRRAGDLGRPARALHGPDRVPGRHPPREPRQRGQARQGDGVSDRALAGTRTRARRKNSRSCRSQRKLLRVPGMERGKLENWRAWWLLSGAAFFEFSSFHRSLSRQRGSCRWCDSSFAFRRLKQESTKAGRLRR